MKFLLNMNLPRSFSKELATRGHECRHVADVGMGTASDVEIIAAAKENNEIILTHDLDYGHILAFSGDSKPSVVIYRLKNTHPSQLGEKLLAYFAELEKPLSKGAIAVIEDASLRIKYLPILESDG